MPMSLRSDNEAIEDAHGADFGTDEEAQRLLPTESLDFEDNTPTHAPSRWPLLHGLGWLQGPRPPQVQRVRPFFPALQLAPALLLNRLFPARNHRLAVFIISMSLWFVMFSLPLRSQLPLRDSNGHQVVNIDCVDALWRPRNDCGLDGINCRPFSNRTFAFRCPAECAGVKLLNPHPVGQLNINYRPFIIGDGIYRGDSFICGSGIHAGVIDNTKGGCGRLTRVGRHELYVNSKRNGLESIPFDSYFPLSFSVSSDPSLRCGGDPRQHLLIVSSLFSSVISIFCTAPVQFFATFIIVFAQVSFASDPPPASPDSVSAIPDHLSMFVKRLLPALFCAAVLYRKVVKRTFKDLDAPLEKTALWLGGFWFGALSNYTFEWIPISRLTAHDLEQQPGAKTALALIVGVISCIVGQQVYYLRLEGRLPRYLALYGSFVFAIVVCLSIPGVSLRIHHYVLALLLLPGTSLQTRPSLLYQGVLLGLFVNGIARWDFDSVLQTAEALRADGAFGSERPVVSATHITTNANMLKISFSWATPPAIVDGISALVNDVERFRVSITDSDIQNFTWTRSADLKLPEYFRFAFVIAERTLDYTEAGSLFANGTWAVGERTFK